MSSTPASNATSNHKDGKKYRTVVFNFGLTTQFWLFKFANMKAVDNRTIVLAVGPFILGIIYGRNGGIQ